jgi:hypothetical protein
MTDKEPTGLASIGCSLALCTIVAGAVIIAVLLLIV